MSAEHRGAPYMGRWWRFPPLRRALISGLALGVAFTLDVTGLVPDVPATVLYGLVAVAAAWRWGGEAVESVMERKVNIDVLMGVATVGSAVLGLWEEAAFLAFLYGAAEGLEEYTYDRTRGAIRSLLDLAPEEARLINDGGETVVRAAQLAPGDMFRIGPGERLPTDGVIRSGETSIDEAAVTGESIPVERAVGDMAFAGTINLTGVIEVQATVAYEDNTLSRIIHLVEEAQEEKTNTQQLIDRFGDRYSPAILIAALLLLVVPPLFGGDFEEWARRAVTLTVAGAPCALVMSTPVAVAAAIGTAGKRGLLIKGGVHLENLGRVQVVAFDKTGTLTSGQPAITDIIGSDGHTPDDVLGLAASVEAHSEHPLGKAIVQHATRQGSAVQPVTGFRALTGAGAQADVDGTTVYVGKPDLIASSDPSAAASIEQLQGDGKTVVAVERGGSPVGLIALRDEPRPMARETVETIHEIGVGRVAMLTGDNQTTAEAIAAQVRIDQVYAGMTPETKTETVRRLEAGHGPVAMIGDGINDAPALAAATVGVAMGAAGTDAAIDAADIALLGEDLSEIPNVIQLGRRVRAISNQNVVFSVLLLAVLIPAAVLGAITVAVAVTVHEVAEIIAVLNGLRARLGTGAEA